MSWKKLCSIAAVTILLITSCLPGFARTEISDRTVFELQSLGIVEGDGQGDLHLDELLTRAEFAALIGRLCGLDDLDASGLGPEFSDVSAEDWFCQDIGRVCAAGMMQGDGDGTFRPGDPVAMTEAMKVLVHVLEYESFAQESGGYPEGYRKVALGAGMTRGVDAAGDTLARRDVLGMIYNCLDVYLGGPSYNRVGDWTLSKETLRDRLQNGNAKTRLYEIRGVMTANASMWLSADVYEELEDDQVMIDGVLYRTEAEDAADYIGRSVECFVREDQYGRQTIVSIRASKDNQVVTVLDRDFAGVQDGRVTYWDGDGKEKSLRLDPGAFYVKNMRVIPDYQEKDIALARGSVTLIDNNKDGYYDVVDAEEFESYLVTEVRGQTIYFRIRSDSQKLKFINFEDNEDKMYQVLDADGTVITPDQIEADTAVSVFESADGSFCRVIAGGGTLEGTIEAVGEDSITVDGEAYGLEPGFAEKLSAGDTAVFYLNFRNEAALMDKDAAISSDLRYGYVAEVANNGTFGDALIAKIALPGEFVEVEEKSAIEDDTSVTLKLKGQNAGVQEMEFAGRVTVDGARMDAKQLMQYFGAGDKARRNRVISYRTNSQGQITQILTPEVVGTELTSREQLRKYNAKEKVFGGKNLGAFGAEETTKVLMIPDYANQGIPADDDYLASVEINDEQEYTINGYDMDQETECVRVITIMTTLKYDSSAAILDRDKLSVLTERAITLDEEQDEITQLTFWSDSAKKSYLVEEGAEDMARALVPGDLFYYALSSTTNRISKILRVDNALRPDRGQGQFGDALDSNPEGMGQITTGVIKDIAYKKIKDIANRRVDRLTIGFESGGEEEVLVNSRNAPPVYLYDQRNHTVEVIETRDITPGEGTVMIHTKNNSVRGIVVVR